MPEGHLLHRFAHELEQRLAGQLVGASSPQGRFADGAARIDGSALMSAEVHGKHLFTLFDVAPPAIVHLHLGRQGLWFWGPANSAPRSSVRLRLSAAGQAADVIAPLVCELTDEGARDTVVLGLGPDPLSDDANNDAAFRAIRASGQAIGALLLDQSVIAGIGNVLRAELLSITGIHPAIEGRGLDEPLLDALWRTSVRVMRQAEREGRIITRRPAGTAVETLNEVEGRFVYGREHCGRCGTALEHLEIAGRAINACPVCQPR
jgi:endonuclease VIII